MILRSITLLALSLTFAAVGYFYFGIHGLQWIKRLVARDRELVALSDSLWPYHPIADQIEEFWTKADHRLSGAWTDHRDINTVMLATSLAPQSYLQV